MLVSLRLKKNVVNFFSSKVQISRIIFHVIFHLICYQALNMFFSVLTIALELD